MNKNDIIKIARQLYLQESISRQLFAKFDIDKQLNQLDGSFSGRPTKDLYSKFKVFIGSNDRMTSNDPIMQFIKKDGIKFTVYGLTSNSQVNYNYSHDIVGWDRLTVYLSAISTKIVSTGNSFHAKIKDLLNLLTCTVYQKYKNETQFKLMYDKLFTKYKGQQLEQRLTKRKIKYVIDAWLNQLINKLDILQQQISQMHLFTISNSSSSIPTYISQVRTVINEKLSQYINKNTGSNDAEKGASIVQDWLLNNSIIGEIQNSVRKDMHTSQNNIKNVTSKISNVWQRIQQINQYVIMFNHYSSEPMVKSLLDAVNTANTSQQFANHISNLGFQYNFDTKAVLLQKYNIDIQDGVQLKKQFTSDKKKQQLLPFLQFVYQASSELKFQSWYNAYGNFLVPVLQNSPQALQLFEKFDNIVSVFQDVQFIESRMTYLTASAVNAGANARNGINKNNAESIMASAQNEMKQKFIGIVQDGDVIVDNIMRYYNNAKGTIQNIMATGAKSIPFAWVAGTKIMTQMKNFINAIEQ